MYIYIHAYITVLLKSRSYGQRIQNNNETNDSARCKVIMIHEITYPIPIISKVSRKCHTNFLFPLTPIPNYL